jgi:D-alanyl-lipoteichoic acid acyltransferase DltB (MBOAT superfamily)
MSVVSLEFVVPLLLAAMVFFHIPGRRNRQLALAACNAAFLVCCLSGWTSWAILAGFVFSGYAVALILRKKSSPALLAAYLILLVAAFMVLKKYAILRPILPGYFLNFAVETLGLSYLLFRQISFLVGVLQQEFPTWSLWSYLNYQFNLFGFLSGPIQRYPEFHDHWSSLNPILVTRHEVLRAFLRMFIGIVKVRLSVAILPYYTGELNWFADPLRGYFGNPLNTAMPGRFHTLRQFALLLYGYPIYLYFNFSGYCDIVIAAAALVGLRMPENFDRPYLSRNITDYWTRFHRTLGFWIRDYLFFPMYKPLVERWSNRAGLLVFPCYFIAFLLAGAWHGTTNNFAVFGALHGIGASAGKGWENLVVRFWGRKGLRGYLASTTIRVFAIALTLTYVSFTMLFFPNSTRVALRVVHEFARRMIG